MIPGSALEKLFMNIEEIHKDGFIFTAIYESGQLIITETQAISKQQPPQNE